MVIHRVLDNQVVIFAHAFYKYFISMPNVPQAKKTCANI